MRTTFMTCFVFTLVLGCGGKKNGADDDDTGPDACVGLECQVVDCASMSMPPTTITGTVFAPNGTLPLNGVNVYVPRDPLPPFTEGVSCDRCSSTLPGSPITQTVSGADGTFRLENVPAGADIPLVVTTGKWRREVTISNVTQCSDNSTTQDQTRLPRNKSEGDIPKIAIATGNADSMECLPRKLGIDDSEITNSSGTGRIHLYAGNGVNDFDNGFAGGPGPISSATPFWSSVDSLSQYDIVILSCEGTQNPNTKPQAALDAMKAYADKGGRVFASHWHNIWIGGNFDDNNPNLAPAVWPTVGMNWGNQGNFSSGTDVIDTVNNPKGGLFSDWMQTVGASPNTPGEFPVTQFRVTVDGVDTTKAEQWVFTKGDGGAPANKPQMFQFTTPLEVANDQRCGKVVFTDMHVSGSRRQGDYPTSCVPNATDLDLTPQEKALAFMFFDISSCVGGLF